jgi:hypothetical protein
MGRRVERLPKVAPLSAARFLRVALLAGLGGAAAVGNAASTQEQRSDAGAASRPLEPPAEPDIVVRGRRWELRFELRLAEEAVYARFNDINSDDLFDVHCEREKRYGSRMTERRCLSNSWREQDANIGEETARMMQGVPSRGLEPYRAEQARMQRLLQEEMLRLALQDDEMNQAVMRLGDTQLELAAARGRERASTRERELLAVDGRLPFGAQRVFEVRIADDPWSQALMQRTFTIALVSGEIRSIDLACDGGSEDLDFEADVEWTIPDDWSACILRVHAQRDTAFALYEF